MRVISGDLGGRRIAAKLPPGIRPTTDRVKESLFSVLGNRLDFGGITVLDLFSGAGSLWIEAVSRGAVSAVSVDSSFKALAYQKNAAAVLRLSESVSFVRGDAIARAKELIERHRPDIVFADPPYNNSYVKKVCDELRDYGGILAIESSPLESPKRYLDSLGFDSSERAYGDTVITVATK